ncbi:class I SAM-dependent methyltransferase [Planomonospora venezuelensis]|uniref:2-polyprenyl-3-methyl-5-hydroxy-6-metoxy-1, 4-benzoquinol methylase n=1 Tax=Planomonospora venezuelensis TaxID=1999 RepID=A0A841DBG9_PLAVE|nr:class I SAM-dependent methyltransferase [Planomonospora venezuelensis]MBB5966107.1 2-polyprenyl-3-methyl-5-hydroxy-6-metoxy-1,4-benzoquinol methylase [Planomonospora venezuelensis]GIN04645.1 SAM-dependent methyltransferase [Planomonospora venezuelensis]
MSTPPTAEEFADRLFRSALGAMEIFSVHLGDRLGWYRALAVHGPATPAELAARAGGHERYAREWLEQQAACGILAVGGDGRFALPPGTAEVLTDESSLAYLAPLARMLTASAAQMPALLEAYRHGGGVGWTAFGADMRESQAEMNRPWYERALPAALAGVGDLDAVLRRPGARIADVGCGGGWSSIALARAYPEATVEGVDVDAPSVELAARNAKEAGLGDEGRLAFRHGDATLLGEGGYDAVFAFECLHDMPRPVETLVAVRRALRTGGTAVVMDEATAEAFTAPAGDVERLLYGFSLLVCLPDGMAHRPSAGTGTVMRPDTLRRYAAEAGFRDVEILPIEDFGFWRFYRLHA